MVQVLWSSVTKLVQAGHYSVWLTVLHYHEMSFFIFDNRLCLQVYLYTLHIITLYLCILSTSHHTCIHTCIYIVHLSHTLRWNRHICTSAHLTSPFRPPHLSAQTPPPAAAGLRRTALARPCSALQTSFMDTESEADRLFSLPRFKNVILSSSGFYCFWEEISMSIIICLL